MTKFRCLIHGTEFTIPDEGAEEGIIGHILESGDSCLPLVSEVVIVETTEKAEGE